MSYKENQLKIILPDLMSIRPKDSDSIIRLLSLARIYVALYRLVAVNALDATFGDRREYTRRSNELFEILRKKADRMEDWVDRALLIAGLFRLAFETSFAYDAKRATVCSRAVVRLLKEYGKKVEERSEFAETCLCRCLTDFFYPPAEEDESEKWFIFLKNTVRSWVATLSARGSWTDLSADRALERIEVMNRQASAILDAVHPTQIRNAYRYYSTHILMRKNYSDANHTEKKNYLYTLARLYDVARQNNVYLVDKETAARAADEIDHLRPQFLPGSDDQLLSLSYVIDNLCESIADERQRELLHGIT